MSSNSICVPRAGRRRNKWYVKFKRSKHLVVWAALVLATFAVVGYAVAKAIKHSADEADNPVQHKIVINPKFRTDSK